jgi:hypothetical protein
MPVHRLHLHSQNRETGSTAADALFSLSKTINNVTSVGVKHVVLANECHNIMQGLNGINVKRRIAPSVAFDHETLTIVPGFYSAASLVNSINALFQAYDDADHTYILLSSDGIGFLWNLPTVDEITIVSGGSADVYIGLNETRSGLFTSSPYLGSPHSVAFVCPQFDHVYTVMSGKDTGIRPFVIMPMNNGYGQHEVYSPQQLFYIPTSSTVLDLLRIRIVDPCTSVLQNVNYWSIELEIKSN